MPMFLAWILLVAAPTPLLDGNGSEHPLVAEDRSDGGLLAVTASLADGLWIGMEFDIAVAADEGSGLVLHLDTDSDSSTGDRDGCELVFDLKARHGSLHPDRVLSGSGRLHERLGLVVSPAFESPMVELHLPPGRLLAEEARFFVVYRGDRVPDAGWITVEREQPPQLEAIDPRRGASGLRVAAWNLERDAFFDAARDEPLRRILGLLDPDVLVVLEAFDHDADDALDRAAALGRTELRHAVKSDPGNVVLSRYPIIDDWPIIDPPTKRRGHRVSAVRIGTPEGIFMIMPAHWRCCAKEGARLFEADATVAFLRDAFTEGGNFTFESELPFLICGDLNLVTTRRPLDVVLSGSVIHKDSFAPDFPAGPGRTPLVPVELRHSHAPFNFTWRPDGSKYYAARLDWVIAPASVRVLRGFVLDTGTMPPDALLEYGLDPTDSSEASDHAPVVVDVEW